MADLKPGEMRLHDYILPPLSAGRYRLDVSTDVTLGGGAQPLDGRNAYFDVDGPRFALAPSELAAVFPPRNGHGPFDQSIPHVALGRRTLPWERAFAAGHESVEGEPIALGGTPIPWMALLMFEEGEYAVDVKQPIGGKLPADVVARLRVPADLQVDTVTVERALLRGVMPSVEELALLAHVREVNVDDRELSAGDSDGFFSVLMTNRIPARGASYRCCLVSIEERTDLVPPQPPPWAGPFDDVPSVDAAGALVFENADDLFAPPATRRPQRRVDRRVSRPGPKQPHLVVEYDSLVLLASWTFQCEGTASFRALMQSIDVGAIGKPHAGGPRLTDTGHQRVEVIDRAGAPETAFYRGPLVAAPLSRDANGPYHSADQARRVAPEVGAEDVSYACAFEVGRLLASSDARLAQELMRWRRDAYQSSVRVDAAAFLRAWMRTGVVFDPSGPLGLEFAAAVVARLGRGCGPLGDPYDLGKVTGAPGFDPVLVQRVFGLASVDDARVLLGIAGDALAAPVQPVAVLPAAIQGIDAVLADAASLGRLQDVRARVIDNARQGLSSIGVEP